MSGDAAVRRPAPIVTEDSAGFWEGIRGGRLVAQRCRRCDRLNHPPRPMCPTCHSVEHDWMELTGRGTVYSYSVLHHPQNPAFDYPVIAVIVETTEGVRIVSTLVDVSPEQVAIGMPVSVRFEPTLHDMAVPVFGPEEAP